MKKITTFLLAILCGLHAMAHTVLPDACIPVPADAATACDLGVVILSLDMAGSTGSISDAAACDGSGYLDRTALGCSLQAGGSYTASVSTGSTSAYTQFWIDFNGDGIFQPTETVGGSLTFFSMSTYVHTLTIPADAPAGTYRMRCVLDYYGDEAQYPNMDPCMAGYRFGEARDYTITIVPAPCNPAITSVSPAVGYPSSAVTITGSNFNTTAANNIVYFGATQATVTSASATSLSVTVPVGATYMPVTVNNTTCHLTASSPYPFMPTYNNSAYAPATENFDAGINVTAGDLPYGVAIGDLDGDGKPDMVASNTSGNTISVYLNTGSGSTYSFAAKTDYAAGAGPWGIAIQDIDGDGKLDVITVNSSTNTVSVFRNTSTGGAISFASRADFTINYGQYSVAVGDIDGDGKPDLAICGFSSNNVSVLLNNSVPGTIAFAPKSDFATGMYPIYVGISDLDGDGKPDLAVTNNGSSSISFFRNTSTSGTVSFDPRTDISTTQPQGLAIGDLDGDGKPDIAVAGRGGNQVNLFRNTGSSGTISFAAQVPIYAGSGVYPAYLSIADIDGDGKGDLAVVNNSAGVNALAVYLNTGSSGSITFSSAHNHSTEDYPFGIAVGDLNGDSKPDIILAGANSNAIAVFINDPLPALMPITGTFSLCSGATTTLSDPTAGGSWSSTNPAVAGIDASSGLVTAVSTGVTTISYTVSGNTVTATITVNSLPAATLSSSSACTNSLLTMSGSVPYSSVVWNNGTSVIRTTTPSPVISTVAASDGSSPIGTFITAGGDLYVADFGGGRVLKYPAGFTTATSGIVVAQNGLTDPYSVFVDGSGNIYVSNGYGSNVIKFPPTSTATTVGTVVAQTGFTSEVGDISVDAAGNLFAADANGNRVLEYPAGSDAGTSPAVVASGFNLVFGISVVDDTLYAADYQGNQILRFDPIGGFGNYSAGTVIAGGNGFGSAANQFSYTPGVALDNAGNIYVNDLTNERVQKFPRGSTSATNGVTVAGGNGYGAGMNQFSYAYSSSIDAAGTIYVSDYNNGRVQVYAPGTATTDTLTAITAGIYSVTVTSASGCISVSNTVTVNTTPASTGATNSGPICSGSAVTLHSNTTGATAWSWIGSNGTTSSMQNPVMTPTATTTYSLTASNSCGNSAIYTTTVVVNHAPAAISGTATVYIGSTTTLNDAVAGGVWSSSNTAIGSVSAVGVVAGISAGTVRISYATSCGTAATKIITVNVPVSDITGVTSMCAGTTSTLYDATTGGTWSSSNALVASVGGTTGVVTGVAGGTATISYTYSGTSATTVVTINALPLPVHGSSSECAGATITLSDATAGGAWTGSGNVTIDGSGNVTGVSAGTGSVTYTGPDGCYVTYPNTIYAVPADILGVTTICISGTTTLSDPTSGGISWTSSNTSVATAINSGVVTGVAAGTATITYKILTGGCTTTATVTVQALPSAITGGSSAICPGVPTALTDAAGDGIWSSSNAAIATVGSATGVVNGIAGGTVRISYAQAGTSGCTINTIVTVNTLAAIAGAGTLCANATVALTDVTTGGTWSSGSTSVATVGSTGLVSGQSAGTANIIYTLPSGCAITKTITVNPIPATIAGNTSVCLGATATLSDAVTGGTWSSSVTGHASIGSATGTVTGAGVGTAMITYTAAGCYNTTVVSVNAQPGVINGTQAICVGATTSLSNSLGGGTWSSIGTATVSATGVVTGGISPGTTTIVYTTTGGCTASVIVTVSAGPGPIGGVTAICAGTTLTLTNTVTGGAWSSSNTAIATIGSASGTLTGVAGGTATITYAGSGCRATAIASINAAPGTINGVSSVCIGATATLTDVTAGGAWSSSNTAAGSISATGVVRGIAVGTTNITYATPAGCARSVVIAVNAAATPIFGATVLCQSATTTLTDAMTGGVWSSSNALAASIGSTGLVTASGTAIGTTTISYTTGGCAATAVLTVNTKPKPVQGVTSECAGTIVTLTDATTGGAWSVSGNATIDGTTGMLTAGAAGSASVTYTLPTGCAAVYPNTIYANPTAILGNFVVCTGATTALSDATSGAISWTSSNTTVATSINSGVVTGVAAGTAIITYKILTGSCIATQVVTVNAGPVVSPISGPTSISHGTPASLSDATVGGVWSSSNSGIIALGGSTGSPVTATAISTSGTATIRYAVTNGLGCTTTVSLNVTAAPAPPHFGSTGLSNVNASENAIALYPNPTFGTINIKADVAGVFYLYALDGKAIGTYKIAEGITSITLPNDLAKGIYMGKYIGDDNNTALFKIVRE